MMIINCITDPRDKNNYEKYVLCIWHEYEFKLLNHSSQKLKHLIKALKIIFS